MQNNASYSESEETKKLEKIKSILLIPGKKRTEQMCLDLMNLTKDFKIFENISMSIEHQNICSQITLQSHKANEIVIKQGEKGDCLFYILRGIVNIKLSKKIDTGIKSDSENKEQTVLIESIIKTLEKGEIFGELALIYDTPRSATIITVTDTDLIRIEKNPFNRYIKNVYEGQLQDQIEFLEICPVFNKMTKEDLIRLGIRTTSEKYATGQIILKNDSKCDNVYLIRRGSVKVVKTIKFIKNEKKVVKKRLRKNRSQFLDFNDLNNRQQIEHERTLELLALGPNEEDIKENNYINKNITLEILKLGDIFPSYYAINGLFLDVQFEADNPCELIVVKLSDIQEIIPDTYQFIKKYAKSYPSEEFMRRFHYYNESWVKYKKDVKCNIMAHALNKSNEKNNNLRNKIYQKKDLMEVKLPMIFSFKRQNMKFK